MNLLDAFILLLAVSAAMGGWRLGLLARAASWVGLAAGLVVAARFLPNVVDAFEGADPTSRLLVAMAVLVGGAFAGQALGLLVGAQFHRALPLGPIRLVDKTLGAVAGVVGLLVAVWFVLPAMADVPGWPSRQSRNSVIAQAIDSLAPAPPDTLQALRRLVGERQFPRVFSDLRPSQDTGPPPASSGLAAGIQQRVVVSTVKVGGIACRRIQEGSGFVVRRDVVVTNAHVVAGQHRTTIYRSDGRQLVGTVSVFDPDRDLAVLVVPGLGSPPLSLGKAQVPETGAVFGHPGGQDAVRVAPASVKQLIIAVGRDLYDSHTTRRQVYVLASDLHPGDSGGPLVDTAGAVIGVAFAIAPDRPGTAYALTDSELRPVLNAANGNRADTGPCLTNP